MCLTDFVSDGLCTDVRRWSERYIRCSEGLKRPISCVRNADEAGVPDGPGMELNKSNLNRTRSLRIEAPTKRVASTQMWPSLYRLIDRRNLNTSFEGETSSMRYSSDTLRFSAINTKIGTQKRTACLDWIGFGVSVRSSAPVVIICKELREFGVRIRNAGTITSDRLAARGFTSVHHVAGSAHSYTLST